MNIGRIVRQLTAVAWLYSANAAEGVITLQSPHGVVETMDRVESAVTARALTVFARIDHAAGANSVGMPMRPTLLLIFGNAQGGTPLMQCSQTAGIDLPLKILVWQDAAARVWLGYNDPAFLAKRHEAEGCPAAQNLREALAGLAAAAITP